MAPNCVVSQLLIKLLAHEQLAVCMVLAITSISLELQMKWINGVRAPGAMDRGAAVVHGTTVYITGAESQIIGYRKLEQTF